MNAKFLLWFAWEATALAAVPLSGQTNGQYSATAFPPIPLNDASRLQSILTAKPNPAIIPLGKSDFVISGPLVEGLRPLRSSEHLSGPQKFLRLPIIRMFVPGPMESPPGTGKYFAWRASDNDEPWVARSSRPAIVKGPDYKNPF